MSESAAKKERQQQIKESVLDPVSRITEILFGLIMVLSFTCSLSIAEVGREDIRDMLIGAVGCNLAWGIIDAFFYLLGTAGERGRERLLMDRIAKSADAEAGRELFSKLIPEMTLASLTQQNLTDIRNALLRGAAVSRSTLITFTDVRAAFLIFGLVFMSTFPVAIPFMVMHEPWPALRASNAIALFLLFSLGCSLGGYAGRVAWVWGLAMVVIGASLVSVTIALGG